MGRSRKSDPLAQGLTKKKRRKEGGKGTKKYGRHKTHCQRYKLLRTREKNKARKQKKIKKMLEKKALRKERKMERGI